MLAPGSNVATLLQSLCSVSLCKCVCVLLSDFIISFHFMPGAAVTLIKSQLPRVHKQQSFMNFIFCIS